MNRNQTSKILMKDEKVLYTYKPYLLKTIITSVLVYLFIAVFLSILYFVPGETLEETARMPFIATLILSGWTLLYLIILVCQILAHRNKFFTVTNKRFIIQKGLLGIDFESIPVNAVQYISVNVSVIDKLLKKGTGTVIFGTISTPVTANQAAKFMFSNIFDVYANYKVFKELSDSAKEEVSN
ncbi:MAG: PH domain-containing protein [Bacilli bacterium]